MFTLAQPAYHFYNPYEELAMQQELQRRRQVEAYLRRQREAEEMERHRQEYEAALRAEYERRREAELERRRQAELQRRRQAQQARGRHSMYDGGLEALFDALYGGQSPRQRPAWENTRGETRSSVPTRKSPTPAARDPTPTPVPVSVSSPAPAPAPTVAELEPEEPQIDTAPSYSAVELILASLATIQSEFTFPTQLDFLPGSSKLAYTPNNAPLHGYEHALTGLLTQLDAVESYGDDGVRKARKEAVKTIEKELERLDGMKAEAWNRVNAPQPETNTAEAATIEANPLAVPLPEDSDVDDEDMEQAEPASESTALEGTPAVDQPSAPEEASVPSEPTSTDEMEATTLPNVEDHTLEQPVDAVPTPMSTSSISNTGSALFGDAALDIASPDSRNPEPLARSLTSPSPSEASESDSDSDLELEEYVDVETMSTSEDEGTELEEVERDGDLELMREWDLDF